MADEIVFSDLPITAASTGEMTLEEAIDVSGYDELDLMLGVQQLAAGATVAVSIITAMQKEQSAGWVTAATFDTVSVAGTYQKVTVRNFLRYVRYSASVTSGGGSFTLTGLARSWR